MKSFSKILISPLLTLAMLLATNAHAQADKVRVGVLLPTSGVYAALGREIEDGFRFAIEDAGVGSLIEVFNEDTEVSPRTGLLKARKLIKRNKVDVLVGIVSSGVLGAVRDSIDKSGVPLIVANAGNNDATGKRCSPNIFRVSFSNAQIVRPMGKWMRDHGVQSAYLMAPNYAAGKQFMAAFAEEFTAHGGKIAGESLTPFRRTTDFGPYLAKARESGAETIFSFYSGSEAVAFVRQYSRFGLSEQLPLYGAGFLTSPLHVNAQGEAAFGVIGSLHYLQTIDSDANRAFVSKFRDRYGRSPSEFAVQGYDSGTFLASALKSGARSSAEITKALTNSKINSPRGLLSLDPKTNNVIQPIYIFETVKGEDGKATSMILDVIERAQDAPNGCVMAAM